MKKYFCYAHFDLFYTTRNATNILGRGKQKDLYYAVNFTKVFGFFNVIRVYVERGVTDFC